MKVYEITTVGAEKKNLGTETKIFVYISNRRRFAGSKILGSISEQTGRGVTNTHAFEPSTLYIAHGAALCIETAVLSALFDDAVTDKVAWLQKYWCLCEMAP
jgi:hypothetical protein